MGLVWNSIPDLVIAWLIAEYFFDGELLTAVFAYVGLQALYLIIWAKNTIWGWLSFGVYGRKQGAAFYSDFFAKNKFPEPDEFETSAEAYINDVVSNESEKVDTRLCAAYLVAFMQYPVVAQRFFDSLRQNMMIEDALENYKNRFTRPTA